MSALPETLGFWMFGLHYSLHDTLPNTSVTSCLLEPIDPARFAGYTSSVKGKALAVVRSLILQLAWRTPEEVVVMLVEFCRPLVANSLKQVRDEVADTLAALTLVTRAPSTDMAGLERSLSVGVGSPLLELLQEMVERATAATDTDSKERLYVREVCLRWSHFLLSHGITHFLSGLDAITPATFEMQDDSDPHLPANARRNLAFLAKTAPASTGDTKLQKLAEHSSWRIRASVLTVIQIKMFYGLHLGEAANNLFDLTLRSLNDPHVEVRQMGAITLAGLVSMSRDYNHTQSARKFASDASGRLKKDDPEFAAKLLKKHSAVLGMEALVLSTPYEIPEWLPSLLYDLSNHASAPNPVRETVKRVFGEFWRTHRDQWSVHKTKFNDDQLTAIQEIVSPSTYYA